jgi:transcriptional regulator with XRE-family HTH domain
VDHRAEKGKIMSTGERLRLLRNRKGYSQVKVQMLTGIDQSDYSKIERGMRYPTIEQVKILSRLFETSMDYLYGLTDETQPYPRTPA